jgi:hypothetical protein
VTRSFVVIRTTALIVGLALAGVTLVYFYLTVVAAGIPTCAQRALLDGDDIRMDNFGFSPLASLALVVMVAAAGRGKRVIQVLETYDLVVFEFASMQITYGMFVIYSTIFVALLMLGLITATTAARYNTIAKYCLAATAVAPSDVIAPVRSR